MPKKKQTTPRAARGILKSDPLAATMLKELEAQILTLPDADKITIRHCLHTGATPPPYLRDLVEAITAATAARDTILEICDPDYADSLCHPLIKALHPELFPATTAEQIEALDAARQWAIVLSMLDKEYKPLLTAAVKSKAEREALTANAKYLLTPNCVTMSMCA